MTSDRELLELAAKAAGYKLNFHNGYAVNATDFHPAQNVHGAKQWNPLTDDGDALRLAVKLKMDLMLYSTTKGAFVKGQQHSEKEGGDPYAATRRAIVRAAAAIGGKA